MVDWSVKFKWQYDFAKDKVASADGYSDEWKTTIQKLQRLLGAEGFSTGDAAALDEVRNKSVKVGNKAVSPDEGFLAAVKAGGNAGPAIGDDAKMRASVLKFLSHVYLVNVSGNRTMWVHSAPKVFQHWESVHMNSWASTTQEVRTLLKDNREQFSERDKQSLANSAKESIAWCQKTNAVLAQAGSRDANTAARAMTIVRRWFADPATTPADLTQYVATLSRGFKGITAMLNKGSLILTDWLPIRGATAADEVSFLNAEAFTFASRAEGLDVVYIEKNFLVDNPGNVLRGSRNWTRILVHELTHLVAGTVDVQNGQSRYAWYGIGPHAGYPGSQCITNADNWAFFCADCAGVLSAAEIATATKIV